MKTAAVVDGIGRDREVESPRSVSAAVPYAAANERALPADSRPSAALKWRRKTQLVSQVKAFSQLPLMGRSEGQKSKLHQQGAMPVLERPKLKLLPRKKQLDLILHIFKLGNSIISRYIWRYRASSSDPLLSIFPPQMLPLLVKFKLLKLYLSVTCGFRLNACVGKTSIHELCARSECPLSAQDYKYT